MKINLCQIAPEGQSFNFDQDSEELTTDLKDLLGKQGYSCSIELKPLGDAVEIEGSFNTKIPVDCSFCGEDYPLPVDLSFKEYLMPKEELRTKKAPKDSKVSDTSEEWQAEQSNGVEGENLLLDQFLRDKIGFSIPFQVPCETNQETCEKYSYAQRHMERHKAPEMEETNPFAALMELDIDKKR